MPGRIVLSGQIPGHAMEDLTYAAARSEVFMGDASQGASSNPEEYKAYIEECARRGIPLVFSDRGPKEISDIETICERHRIHYVRVGWENEADNGEIVANLGTGRKVFAGRNPETPLASAHDIKESAQEDLLETLDKISAAWNAPIVVPLQHDLVGYHPYSMEHDRTEHVRTLIEEGFDFGPLYKHDENRYKPDASMDDIRENLRLILAHGDRDSKTDPVDVTGLEGGVTFLVCGGGSARGFVLNSMIDGVVYACAKLEAQGIATRILGHTTVAWRNGPTWQKWKDDGRPVPPKNGGFRLSDLLHVVFKDFDEAIDDSLDNVALATGNRYPKENVNGEAIAWAVDAAIDHGCQTVVHVTDKVNSYDDVSFFSAQAGRTGAPDFLDRHMEMMIADAAERGVHVAATLVTFPNSSHGPKFFEELKAIYPAVSWNGSGIETTDVGQSLLAAALSRREHTSPTPKIAG